MQLFREEVLNRGESLHGTINLAVPMSWQLIAGCLAGIVAIAFGFLLTASYSRTEVAAGSIVPSGGILQVIPPRIGRVDSVLVQEGQRVRKGQPLLIIHAEEADRTGGDMGHAIMSAIDVQRDSLNAQQQLARAAGVAEQAEFGAQIAGSRQEVANIETQISVQQKLVDMAQIDLSQASAIASRGFISRRDIAVRQEALLSRQQQLASLEQARAAKLSSIEQGQRAQRQAAAKVSQEAASIASTQAQIERDRATARGAEGYTLVAPTDGQIAALTAHPGAAINSQDPAMVIVPAGGRLVAEFNVPGKAAGFVRVGLPVRLALDAYPPDRFGTVDAVISTLSAAPVLRTDRSGNAASFFVATAKIAHPEIKAYGRSRRLLPGMTFSARILIEHRSIFQWLFDPLLAAARHDG